MHRLVFPAVAGAFVLLLATCAPATPPMAGPGPATPGEAPEIRIGLVVGAARVELAGDSGLALLDADGAMIGVTEPAAATILTPLGAGLVVRGAAGGPRETAAAVTVGPRADGGLVRVNGRPYRGRVTVGRDRAGLTVVNSVGMEQYLAGVISAEMGRRDTTELAALEAQAIVSRTFAIRNLGKRVGEGFDLFPTVVDQVYGGAGSESGLGWRAVRETAGQVVTWNGVPIDAFFYSTCAGRTAAGTEVYAGADRPYLQSLHDEDPAGAAWCRISPRYRWREEWTAEQLQGVLRQSLPAATGTAAGQVGTVRGVRVASRTGSDRVARLTIALGQGAVQVEGPAVRQVLRPVGETTLRSAAFVLTENREGGVLKTLVADGRGAGHAVGFCQWGAVGRARAGQDAATIIGAYFPGTALSRAY